MKALLGLLGSLLELLRIIIIFLLLGGLGRMLVGNLYTINKATETYSWLGTVAIFILLFVLYRNKLQFSGFYMGEGKVKLAKPVSHTLILVSLLLIALPFVLGPLLG